MKRLGALAALLVGLAGAPALAGVWPTEIDRIARQLEASEATERRAAAGRLAGLPVQVARALLPRAVEDPDADVRLAAAAALVAHRLPPPEERILTWMNEQDARLRLAACQALQFGASAQAIPALSRALGDADPRVRQGAAVALGNTSLGDGVVALLGHLDDPTPEVRIAVVDALWKLGDARAVVPLAGKVQDATPEVRRAVVRALGELGDARATNALVLALRDANQDVRVDALISLGLLADPSALPALIPMIEPLNPPPVRRAALMAMGQIRTPKALELLVRALEHDEARDGQAPARDALVQAGAVAVPALLGVLAAPPSERTVAAAAEALGALRSPEARDPILGALRRGVLPAAAALRGLRGLRDPGALQAVLEHLDDRSGAVRAEARLTLEALLDGKTAQGQVVDPIAAMLADGKTPAAERPELVRLLGASGSPRAAALLAPLAATPPLRLAVIEALGSLADASDTRPLVAALEDESAQVRARAGAALALAGGDAEAILLLDRVASAQQQDRSALATALAGALGRASSPATFQRAAALLMQVDGPTRDAMLEGLGRAQAVEATAPLLRAVASADAADRRKAAESLGGRPEGRDALRGLLADPDSSVRASAAWALGSGGKAEDVPALLKVFADPVVTVAANAMTSVGRIVALVPSAREEATRALCQGLQDGRPHARAGALSGLRQARSRCEQGDPERRLLLHDPSPTARAAAADLLRAVPSAAPERDRRALSRCRREDPYGSVATRCAAREEPGAGEEPVVVLVVPDGKSVAAAEAPFALRLADQRVRHGVTDRRGVVFEGRAPAGLLRLEVPAVLSR